jgi:hypothetical protein
MGGRDYYIEHLEADELLAGGCAKGKVHMFAGWYFLLGDQLDEPFGPYSSEQEAYAAMIDHIKVNGMPGSPLEKTVRKRR